MGIYSSGSLYCGRHPSSPCTASTSLGPLSYERELKLLFDGDPGWLVEPVSCGLWVWYYVDMRDTVQGSSNPGPC